MFSSAIFLIRLFLLVYFCTDGNNILKYLVLELSLPDLMISYLVLPLSNTSIFVPKQVNLAQDLRLCTVYTLIERVKLFFHIVLLCLIAWTKKEA